jgi:hypothetical protein
MQGCARLRANDLFTYNDCFHVCYNEEESEFFFHICDGNIGTRASVLTVVMVIANE